MRPWDVYKRQLLEKMVSSIPVYHLECLPDAEAVKLVCRTLYGDGYEADSEWMFLMPDELPLPARRTSTTYQTNIGNLPDEASHLPD